MRYCLEFIVKFNGILNDDRNVLRWWVRLDLHVMLFELLV